MNKYRSLTPQEIEQLERQFCQCDDWSLIEVVLKFSPDFISNVVFSGRCLLGLYDGSTRRIDDLSWPVKTGLRHTHLHQVKVEDNVTIEGAMLITCPKEAYFGNGVKVAAVNENGGRAFPIYEGMNAQDAYALCLYGYREELHQIMLKAVDQFVSKAKASMSVIGQGAIIFNTGILDAVRIRPYAQIIASARLTNVTVESSKVSPTYIGTGVILKDAIIEDGTSVTDGVQLERCLIGQSCQIGKAFSGIDSVFFSNSELMNGEAQSVFGGPFTVSHHKSTLLIGGFFSFYNAGSATNQSNHAYKTGPVHQGIMQRGCKTGSSSYIQWPAYFAPFTLVVGRHYTHPNIPYLPFSILVEKHHKSYVKPGLNLFRIGTFRDMMKWPHRDRRKGKKYDKIHFDLVNPHTLNSVVAGLDHLNNLRLEMTRGEERFVDGCYITYEDCVKGARYYTQALNMFFAIALLRQLDKEINVELWEKPLLEAANWKWMDMAGCVLPEFLVDDFARKQGEFTLEDIHKLEESAYLSYDFIKWSWVYAVGLVSAPSDTFTASIIIKMLKSGVRTLKEILHSITLDLQKDYSSTMMVGYGVDATKKEGIKDFSQVRGQAEDFETFKTIEQAIHVYIQRLSNKIATLSGEEKI